MKKRLVTALTAVCACSILLSGCQGASKIDTKELALTGYKGIEVEQVEKPEEVTEEDVESAIDATLQTNATQSEVTDRGVEDGDVIDMNFVGKIDGEEFEGGSAENYSYTMGSNQFIDGMEESILGHKPGETYDWDGAFPEDYANAEYAGKDVTFTITVNSIAKEEIPELNDDFVKKVSEESKTVKEYKAEIKKLLEEDGQTTYDDTLTASVWQAVLDKAEVKKYPEDDVKEISDMLIEQYKSAAEYYSMDYETFLKDQMNSTVEDFEAQVEEAAKSSVKQTIVTEAIAEKEKLTLSDKVYEEQLKQMAKTYGYEDTDALKEAAEEKDLKDIALNNVVKQWLTDHCVQVAASKSE